MNPNKKDLKDIQKIMLERYPSFSREILSVTIKFEDGVKTACTDGRTIYFGTKYWESLDLEEKVFLFAHETMHIKFEHMYRINRKDGVPRDGSVWGIATDAIINANLKRDGFKLTQRAVCRDDALNFNADELYDIMMLEKQAGGVKFFTGHTSYDRPQMNKINEKQDPNQNQNVINPNTIVLGEKDKKGEEEGESEKKTEQELTDDHEIWNHIPKNKKEIQAESEEKNNEKNKFESNREERAAKLREKFNKQREIVLSKKNKFKQSEVRQLPISDDEVSPVIDWRLVLRREIEKSEILWTRRYSIDANNYAYRLSEEDVAGEADTYVMIDVSLSIDNFTLRGFLVQLKPLIKESRLKVGFFAATATDFTEIKSKKDIDSLKVANVDKNYTNFDAAWAAFYKSAPTANKIIFTDGEAELNPDTAKPQNVIWVVINNSEFKPCYGKVISVDKTQLNKMKEVWAAGATGACV